jgi:hypothetical protein
MSTGIVDELVADYLARLAAAATALPPDRRAELLTEIREHIDAARVAGAAADEPAVRTLLDRLGEPAEIVAAAADDQAPVTMAATPAAPPPRSAAHGAFPPAYPPPTARRSAGVGLETAAVVLLTVGSFIPVLGWAVGAVLLWSSPRWSRGEKLLGTLVVPGGPGLVILLSIVPARTCVGGSYGRADGELITTVETCSGFALPTAVAALLAAVVLVAPFIVAAVLLRRARARATQP